MSRPWRALYWVPYTSESPGVDRLMMLDGAAGGLVERHYEYRLVYDQERDAWRVDRRATA